MSLVVSNNQKGGIMKNMVENGTADYGVSRSLLIFLMFITIILIVGILGIFCYFKWNLVVYGSLLMGLAAWVAGCFGILEGGLRIGNVAIALIPAACTAVGFWIGFKGIAGPILILLSFVGGYVYVLGK
jgi:hypothetical protein